ncbi:MAG: hypothetical protein LBO62_01520, partial [Endomicrobium sp.]|nr:hypothetical protein [Endomicrobium sp.]
MKKILTAAVSMFVLCGLMVSCSEDDKNKIIRNEQNGNTVNTTVPNDTMAQDEKDTINNAETLSLVDYEIYELRFGSYYFSDGSQEFTLGSNAKYSFVFGLRDNKTGHIAYYTIQNSTWTFSSDNAAITKYADTGFNASSSFYSNANAEITVDISYKGLNKSFKFTLKSTVKNPNENPQ